MCVALLGYRRTKIVQMFLITVREAHFIFMPDHRRHDGTNT